MRKLMAAVVVSGWVLPCSLSMAAPGYLGEGVQGRPHAHDAAVKNFYYRHHMGYTTHPKRGTMNYYRKRGY